MVFFFFLLVAEERDRRETDFLFNIILLCIYLYILRGFKKLVINFFPVKNTPKLINQQLKNEIKIVN